MEVHSMSTWSTAYNQQTCSGQSAPNTSLWTLNHQIRYSAPANFFCQTWKPGLSSVLFTFFRFSIVFVLLPAVSAITVGSFRGTLGVTFISPLLHKQFIAFILGFDSRFDQNAPCMTFFIKTFHWLPYHGDFCCMICSRFSLLAFKSKEKAQFWVLCLKKRLELKVFALRALSSWFSRFFLVPCFSFSFFEAKAMY